MPPTPKKIVIIGGGAAGVFTAYRLARSVPGCFDVTILEKNPKVGGHAHSHSFVHNAQTVHIDGGAQFFSETAQPEYLDLLLDEGLFGYVTQHDAGVTIWDRTARKRLFWIPPDLDTMIQQALANAQNTQDYLNFIWFVINAIWKDLSGDWTETFGTWLDSIDFLGTPAQDEEFRANIARPLMYQFGLVKPSDLHKLSARFVIYYFVRSLPLHGGSAPFRVLNCEIGLDGVLQRLVTNYSLDVKTGKTITAVVPQGAGYVVHAQDGSTHPADEVVFATNPNVAAALLPSGPQFAAPKALLSGMNYLWIAVPIQKQQLFHMPSDQNAWSVSNVLVERDSMGDPTHYMLSIWFGPLRPQAAAADFTKSWGSPHLLPTGSPNVTQNTHDLMVGTPDFMQRREQLLAFYQGQNHIWYAGGWSLDYDTQNSSLKSAIRIANELTAKCLLDPWAELISMLTAWLAMARAPSGMRLAVPRPDPVREDLPELYRSLLHRILEERRDHPAVEQWIERGYPQ